jgi:hypothetical protein
MLSFLIQLVWIRVESDHSESDIANVDLPSDPNGKPSLLKVPGGVVREISLMKFTLIQSTAVQRFHATRW